MTGWEPEDGFQSLDADSVAMTLQVRVADDCLVKIAAGLPLVPPLARTSIMSHDAFVLTFMPPSS